MNERVRELAEQALFKSDFDDEQNIKITLDRFAELIVQECVEIALKHIYNDGSFSFIPNVLNKHFGIVTKE